MVYEFICIVTNWWNLKYWGTGSNYIDLASQAATLFLAIETIRDPKEDYRSKEKILFLLLKLITMLWLLTRSVTWFRIFKPTRYLVTMILVVFKKIFFFVVFMVIFILTYAYCWRTASLIAHLQDLETGDDEMNFYASLLISMNVVFGNTADLYEDDKKMSIVQTVVFVIGNIAIGLAYLNFLIAIISGVYERVESNKHLYDVKEIITLVKDFDMYYYGWKSMLNWVFFGRCFKKQRDRAKRYIMFLPKEDSSEFDSLNDKIDKINEEMKNQGSQIETKFEEWATLLENSLETRKKLDSEFKSEVKGYLDKSEKANPAKGSKTHGLELVTEEIKKDKD
jgi:hypothetical protein